MPSKDILSIKQFEINNPQQQSSQLYPRAYAVPQFFTKNLLHQNRVIKVFTGQNAILKAFYFNYMKLAIQSQNSQEYIQLLKQIFVSFDQIQEGQLEDRFLSDFQYRKFFKDFIQIAKKAYSPDFQDTAKIYPIIDEILLKLFKTIVPIALFLPEDDDQPNNDFDIVLQIVQFLCQKFQQQFQIQIQGKCLKFQASQMFLYVENLEQIYIAYIDNNQNQKPNIFTDSSSSSFVCGQGNSFTSKFKSNQKNSLKNTATYKHPFKKVSLQNTGTQNNKTRSIYGYDKLYDGQKLKINSLQQQQENTKKIIQETQKRSSYLQSKSSLIQRRSKNSNFNNTFNQALKHIDSNNHQTGRQKHNSDYLQKFQTLPICHPVSCFQYEQMQSTDKLKRDSSNSSSNQNQSSNQNGINYSPTHSLNRDQQKATTLINILDSRVTDFTNNSTESNEINLISKQLQKMPQKSYLITRRKSNQNLSNNKTDNNNKNNYPHSQQIISKISPQKNYRQKMFNNNPFQNMMQKYGSNQIIAHNQFQSDIKSNQLVINLPQPKINQYTNKNQQNISFKSNKYTQLLPQPSNPQPYLNTKHSLYYQIQQIQQLGQDQDTQNTIKQPCQIQLQQKIKSQHQQKIITITDQLQYKLWIQKIQSRNIQLSRISIKNGLNQYDQKQKNIMKLSFFDDKDKINQSQSSVEDYQLSEHKENSSIVKSGKQFQNQQNCRQFTQFKTNNLNNNSKPTYHQTYQQFITQQLQNKLPFKQKNHNILFNSPIKSTQKVQQTMGLKNDIKLTSLSNSKNKFVKFNQTMNFYERNNSNIERQQQIAVNSGNNDPQSKHMPLQISIKHTQSSYIKQQPDATMKSNIFKQIHNNQPQQQNFIKQQSITSNQPSQPSSLSSSLINDQFTKSDILLLLDQQYRLKIRCIKNQYKSTIKQDYHHHHNTSILRKQYNQSNINNNNNGNKSKISIKSIKSIKTKPMSSNISIKENNYNYGFNSNGTGNYSNNKSLIKEENNYNNNNMLGLTSYISNIN